MNGTDWKARGNKAIAERDYNTACFCYTKAIELDASNPIYFTNRSMALFAANRFEEALKDAIESTSLNPSWAKGYYRAGEALLHMNRLKEATVAFQKCLDLEPADNLVKDKFTTTSQQYIQRFFAPITDNTDVLVKYVDMVRGRGVFAKKNFKKGEIVFTDIPLASHRVTDPSRDHVSCCSYTLQSIISPTQVSSVFQEPLRNWYRSHPSQFVPCQYCQVSLPALAILAET